MLSAADDWERYSFFQRYLLQPMQTHLLSGRDPA